VGHDAIAVHDAKLAEGSDGECLDLLDVKLTEEGGEDGSYVGFQEDVGWGGGEERAAEVY